MKMVRVEDLDTKMLDILRRLSLHKELIEQYIKTGPITVTPIRDGNTIKREISNVERKIENLTAALQESEGSSAAKYIISEIEKLDKQIASLNYELRELEFQEEKRREKKENVNVIYSKICTYLKKFDKLPYAAKVKYLQEIIKECVWDGNTLEITI
jgi:site-specific DNA recombinase